MTEKLVLKQLIIQSILTKTEATDQTITIYITEYGESKKELHETH